MNYTYLLTLAAFLVIAAPFLLIGAYREGKRRRRQRGEVPLGISEAYDLLPPDGEKMRVRCQDCDQFYMDRMRKHGMGARVLAVFCPDCRSCRRARLAEPLPTASIARHES